MRARDHVRAARSVPVQSQGTAQTCRLRSAPASAAFPRKRASCFSSSRRALDGFPSGAAAQRAIWLRHDASIGARLRVAQGVRAVETKRSVEKKESRRMNISGRRIELGLTCFVRFCNYRAQSGLPVLLTLCTRMTFGGGTRTRALSRRPRCQPAQPARQFLLHEGGERFHLVLHFAPFFRACSG